MNVVISFVDANIKLHYLPGALVNSYTGFLLVDLSRWHCGPSRPFLQFGCAEDQLVKFNVAETRDLNSPRGPKLAPLLRKRKDDSSSS